jgi:hypothetical protein
MLRQAGNSTHALLHLSQPAEAHPTFTLHGTPHDMTVPMQVHIDGNSLTAKTHFVIPYVQWGLKDPSVFILNVAKEVEIDLTLAGRVTPAN